MGSDNISLARKLIDEVWNKGNFSLADEIVAQSCTSMDPMHGEMRGRDAFKDHVRTMRTAFPDLHCAIEEIGMANGHVYMRWMARGTNRGPFFGMSASNARAAVRGISILRVDGGKITDMHAAWDTYSLLSQLGLAPTFDKLSRQTGAAARS